MTPQPQWRLRRKSVSGRADCITARRVIVSRNCFPQRVDQKVSEPGAVATGSRGTLENQKGSLIRSLLLPVLRPAGLVLQSQPELIDSRAAASLYSRLSVAPTSPG